MWYFTGERNGKEVMSGWSFNSKLMSINALNISVSFHCLIFCSNIKRGNFSTCVIHPNYTAGLCASAVPFDSPQLVSNRHTDCVQLSHWLKTSSISSSFCYVPTVPSCLCTFLKQTQKTPRISMIFCVSVFPSCLIRQIFASNHAFPLTLHAFLPPLKFALLSVWTNS